MEENLKENEPAPANGPTSANDPAASTNPANASAPATRPKNKVLHLVREMWPAYLIEILVIILGISITLALEEWRDNVKERRIEQIYLKNLQRDIEQDRKALHYASTETQKILARADELLALFRDPAGKKISTRQFNADVRAMLARPDFMSNDATFSDLKSSGNLHLLEDLPLKNLLFSYYSKTQNITNNQQVEQQATITLTGVYFLKQFPLDDFRQDSSIFNGMRELSKNNEFSNNILLRVSNRKELLGLYQTADSLAAQLTEELSQKTN